MKILKICTSDWKNASRDKRELSVCCELGMDVTVLAKGKVNDKGRVDEVDGFKVLRYTTRPNPKLPIPINRILSIFQWAKYTAILQPDIISGHDMSGWTIGWLSQFYNRKYKPLLVYDSHEFELGRNSRRNKIKLWAIKRWEKKILKDSVFTIVVNDSIADELVQIYKLKKRPLVVRSIPEKWNINQNVCEEKRKEFESMFGKY